MGSVVQELETLLKNKAVLGEEKGKYGFSMTKQKEVGENQAQPY